MISFICFVIMLICFVILNKFFNLKKMCCNSEDSDGNEEIEGILARYKDGE